MKELELFNASELDPAIWLAMRKALWPEEEEAQLKVEINSFFNKGEKSLCLLGKCDSLFVSLVEARIKPASSNSINNEHVFIDAWYVIEPFRRKGIGTQLINAVEKWTRKNNLFYLASDTTPEYPYSPKAHKSCGFIQQENDLFFIKKLN